MITPVSVLQLRSVLMDEMLDVYEELQQKGFTPDAFTLNSMVGALAAANATREVSCGLAAR